MAVTIAWDDGVATVKIGADEAFATAGLDYTATNITVASGVTSLAVVATYAEGKEKIFLFKGISNGLETELKFRRTGSDWKLTKINL